MKEVIYVTPFVVLAAVLGANAGTDWVAIGVGVAVGVLASVLFVAVKQALRPPTEVLRIPKDKLVSAPAAGRLVGAPRSTALVAQDENRTTVV